MHIVLLIRITQKLDLQQFTVLAIKIKKIIEK